MTAACAEVERIEVGSVHYGDGVAEHVVVSLAIAGARAPVMMVLKSADEVDKLIMALTRHRVDVFGEFRS